MRARGPAAFRGALLLAALALVGGSACRPRTAPAKAAPAEPERVASPAEADSAREARENRATAVAGFPVQAGLAAEACPVLLAPDYGSPKSGAIEEGAEVQVVLVEPGFYGIRLPEKGLAFVPARCVRLLPGPLETPAVSRPRREIVPEVRPLGAEPGTVSPSPAPGPGVAAPAPAPTSGPRPS